MKTNFWLFPCLIPLFCRVICCKGAVFGSVWTGEIID